LSTISNYVVVGKAVTMTCTTDDDLDSKHLLWRRNGESLTYVYVNSTGCFHTASTPDPNYNYSCGNTPIQEIFLTIPSTSMTEEQNGSEWQCVIITEIASSTLTLFIVGMFYATQNV